MDVPYYSYEDIVQHAIAFSAEFNPTGECPVPIEQIAEFELGLDIVPTPNLQQTFEVDAFTTRDLKQIWVDEYILEHRYTRYRFSLAHEIGHIRLHPGVLSDACFSTISEWKSLVADGMTEHDYSWFEWHANAFAGLVLVPRNDLEEKYEQTCSMLMGYGLEPTSDACCERIAKELAQYFEVSPSGVIERRLRKENWFQD